MYSKLELAEYTGNTEKKEIKITPSKALCRLLKVQICFLAVPFLIL
jgi:hypothetical protein